MSVWFFFECSGDHRDLHVLALSLPTRRSSDLGRLAEAVAKVGGCILLTADHGNAEQMSDAETGQAHTAHTMNKVPLLLIGGPDRVAALQDGRLADIEIGRAHV